MIDSRNLNTLRNQIFIGSLFVMMLVLGSIAFILYQQVSVLLRNNAESHIEQTAIQTTGKLEALVSQIDTWTSQVATDPSVQLYLAQESAGRTLSFTERQNLQEEVRKLEAYAASIRSIEIYTKEYRRLLPLDDVQLDQRVEHGLVDEADRAQGRLVWFGIDPRDSHSVVAIRNIRLINQSFEAAGYLVVRIDKSYFQLTDTQSNSNRPLEYMNLFDGAGKPISIAPMPGISANIQAHQLQSSIQLDGKSYITVTKPSEKTSWNLVILSPADYKAEGISLLQTVIIVSGIGGALLFIILSFFLSTMITKPILNLIKVMRNSKFGTLKPSTVTSATLEIRELNNTYNQMVDRMNELVEVVYQKEILQSRTELKALQSQINPHFLFNTLEAFYWALDEKGEDELAESVIAMSGLFRYVINRGDEDEWVAIDHELTHAERYLTIMNIRMGDRLSWSITCDPSLRSVPIPKLLIQPLVENAILHGIEQQVGPGSIELTVSPSERPGYTQIIVKDSGPGMDDEKIQSLYTAMKEGRSASSKGKGIGIANIYGRLKLSYSTKEPEMRITSQAGKGTVIALTIPNEPGGSFYHEDNTHCG
ncbi:sensor histidine kinase [Paenibacillus sp. FSL W8-0426]|uniref:cache domain-containing sensor histidine kinase n=1 Tax=Paenibacillus sp. FSL W8-0426 TaxID=2921714 RepID=UPI0030D76284